MKFITKDDLEALKLGCTVLGSGGGGDPAHELIRAKEILEKRGNVPLIDVSDLKDDDFIMPFAFMGAPIVCIEKLSSGKEGHILKSLVEKDFQKKVTCILCSEIGGSNAIAPIVLASELNLPLIDGDTLGRAFPELQISSCTIYGIPPNPAFLCDPQGNSAMLRVDSCHKTEKVARACTQTLGSNVALSIYIMNGKKAKQALVRNTYSEAIQIGKGLLEKKPLCDLGLELVGKGTVSEFIQEISDGFSKGSIHIIDSFHAFTIDVQNEYLIVFKNGIPIVTTPDIICIFDEDGNTPLPSEKIKYGMNVCIYKKPAPKVWKTAKGLFLTGPRAFGYEFDYIERINI